MDLRRRTRPYTAGRTNSVRRVAALALQLVGDGEEHHAVQDGHAEERDEPVSTRVRAAASLGVHHRVTKLT
jgi:HEAT repeat protein